MLLWRWQRGEEEKEHQQESEGLLQVQQEERGRKGGSKTAKPNRIQAKNRNVFFWQNHLKVTKIRKIAPKYFKNRKPRGLEKSQYRKIKCKKTKNRAKNEAKPHHRKPKVTPPSFS